MRLRVERVLPLAGLILLGGCLGMGVGGGAARVARDAAPQHGPAADFPVVLGEPFTIGEVRYEPADRMNYDAVGRASVAAGGSGVSAAHKTLPMPSYVEVTSLDTGRTALVRIERRGPMRNDVLIELSPAAAGQLGLGDAAPVRVRRVNPPEADRELLRAGREAPARMDTPKSLLGVLMRKLDGPRAASAPALPATDPPAMTPPAVTPPAEAPVAAPSAAARGTFYVQVAAFSTGERAEAAARAIGGHVAVERGLWLLRLGPFASAAQARPALAKAVDAGYGDARIRRAD